ncbi:tetratricopeptide repeat protein, partial [bacterium]|nr:tetratricopeptide repeat protein [bacterium]
DTEIGARYRRRLVQAYLNSNRLDDAERDILALDNRDPEKNSFLRLLLQKFEANGMLERLRQLALELPDTMVEKQQYIDGVAHSYLTSGDLAMARQELYSMAEALSASGDHSEAESLYAKLLAWHPVDVDIRLRMCQEQAAQGALERAREGMLILAGRFHNEGNTTSAADIYARLLEIDPDNLNARYRLGDIWAEQGQTAQALEQFALLAKVYLQQNLPEVAQRVLHRILDLDPKDVLHRRQLIQLLTRNLRFEEATEHHRHLLEIFLERGELNEARSCVREIVTLQPLNLDLRQRLGEMFLDAGFLEEGQGLMEELASTYKGRGDHDNVVKVFTTLSKSFENNQQWDTALEYLERVADEQVEADNWGLAQENYVYALKMYLLRGRKENVDPLFVRFVDGFFRHRSVNQGVKLLEELEQEFVAQDRLDLALVIKDRLASVMERLSEWSQALNIVVSMSHDYQKLGDSEQAINSCRRAADLALHNGMVPRGIELLYELLALTIDSAGLDAAKVVMGEIKQRANGDAKMIERIGDILFKKGLLDEAREIYDEVLVTNPASVGALSRIAVICARDGKLDEVASIARRIVTNGLIGQVVDEYSKVLGGESNDALFHIRMGEFYQQIGFLDEAIIEFYKASRDPAKTLLAVNNLAKMFSMKGYNNLAIRQLVKTLDQPGFNDDELLDLRYNLAQILEKEGRLKEALLSYQECFAVDIGFRDVSDRIDYLYDKVDVATYNSDVFNYDDDDF